MSEPEPTDLNETRATLPPIDSSRTAPVFSPTAGLPSSPPGYEILGELGRGGMGVVYKARQTRLKRLVALKMILAGSRAGAGDLARFKAEAEAAARLQHANIVAVHEVGEHEGCPFFSLEYVEGGSLDRHLAGTPLAPSEATRLSEALARAMQVAHEANIVHRDLKPANVLLANGEPKISDFGLAKNLSEDSGQTRSGAVLGTPSYMAPEQAAGKGKEVGPAADVWALGALLYEMLTARPPFKGANATETLLQVIADDPVPPSRLVPRLPRDLETICLKCLHKEPQKRYSSAAALADDLHRFRNGEPIVARPVGLLERGLKWARRRPALAALLLVSLIATVGFMVLQERQRREAETRSATERRLRDEAETASAQLDREKTETARLLDLSRRNAFTAQLRRVAGMWQREPEQARDLLEDENLCPPELRDFSWGFYRRLCECGRGVLRGHSGRVMALALTADGKSLASAGADGLVIVWDLAAQQPRVTLRGHKAAVWCVALTPDGKTAASGSQDGEVKVWDVASGKEKIPLKGRHTGSVWGVALTPDGSKVASGSAVHDPQEKDPLKQWKNGEVFLWDTTTGGHTRLFRSKGGILCVACDPDGEFVAAGGFHEGGVRLWNMKKNYEVRRLGPIQPGVPVRTLALSPAPGVWQRVLGAATSDPAIKLFLPSRRRARFGELRGHLGEMTALAFGNRFELASVNRDGTVKVWEVQGRRERTTFRLEPAPAGPWPGGAVVLNRGLKLLAAADGALVRLWAIPGQPYRKELLAARHGVLALAVAADGKTLVTGGTDGNANLWDLTTGTVKGKLEGKAGRLRAVALTPDGKTLVTAAKDRKVRIWDVDKRQFRATLDGQEQLALTPDGRKLVTAGGDGSVTVWDLEGKEVRTLSRPGGTPFTALTIGKSGSTVLCAAGTTGGVRVWDVERGREFARLAGPDKVATRCLAFSPDGKWLAVGFDQTLYLWQPRQGGAGTKVAAGHRINALAFSNDGQSLALGGSDLAVRVWDVATWQQRAVLRGHSHEVTSLAFGPDGKSLISGSGPLLSGVRGKPGEVLIWDGDSGEDLEDPEDPFDEGAP
jgi:WD40 repeat protein/tRNA A-37 threonylcarbamoyl transferase component Bud32